MAVINFSNVTKYYDLDLILDHVSFQINKNENVALIGDNGVGKTTIFKLILKEIEPTLVAKEDKVGEISILKDFKIGYLSQDAIKNVDNLVIDELREPFLDLIKLNEEFNKVSEEYSLYPDNEEIVEKYNKYLERIENSRVFSYQNEIETLISKFSFPLSILNKRVKELSGGERMKIAFIKLLLFRYDCLLLDEPTNHLDISTIEWLEEYLKNYSGTIIFISHDRYFIDSVSSKILELENHIVTTYNMSYNSYLEEKEIRFKNQLEQYKKEEEEMEKLRKFIEFYMPKPRFVGRAKDRVKKLEKLEARHIEQPKKVNHNIKINLEGGNLKNKELIEVKELVIGYDKPLINDSISFSLYGKDFLAILGDNGVGKTTLIKTILGDIPALNGEIKEKRKLSYGYIRQNDYSFHKSDSILEHLKRIYPTKSENELRGALGRFLFRKEEVFKEVSTLSNGEKMRVNLCALMLSSYDILILDEPTNHLDLVTKECLIDGLKHYNGAVIFISHDRYFINELADYILYLKKDKVTLFEGNYDEFKLKEEEEKFPRGNFLENNNSLNSKNNIDKKNPLEGVLPKKEKLSNNKINELKIRLKEIEEDIATIDALLEDDEVDYLKVSEYQTKKEELEDEYLIILDKLN